MGGGGATVVVIDVAIVLDEVLSVDVDDVVELDVEDVERVVGCPATPLPPLPHIPQATLRTPLDIISMWQTTVIIMHFLTQTALLRLANQNNV